MEKHENYDWWHPYATKFFTEATTIAAEGNRIGIASCRICGAAILLDSRDDWETPKKHAEWHMELQTALENSNE